MVNKDPWNDPLYIRDTVIAQDLIIHELLKIIGEPNRTIYAALAEAMTRYISEAGGNPGYEGLVDILTRHQTYYREFSWPDRSPTVPE